MKHMTSVMVTSVYCDLNIVQYSLQNLIHGKNNSSQLSSTELFYIYMQWMFANQRMYFVKFFNFTVNDEFIAKKKNHTHTKQRKLSPISGVQPDNNSLFM